MDRELQQIFSPIRVHVNKLFCDIKARSSCEATQQFQNFKHFSLHNYLYRYLLKQANARKVESRKTEIRYEKRDRDYGETNDKERI